MQTLRARRRFSQTHSSAAKAKMRKMKDLRELKRNLSSKNNRKFLLNTIQLQLSTICRRKR